MCDRTSQQPQRPWPEKILVGQAPRPGDRKLVDLWYLPQGPSWRYELRELRRAVVQAGGRLADGDQP